MGEELTPERRALIMSEHALLAALGLLRDQLHRRREQGHELHSQILTEVCGQVEQAYRVVFEVLATR